MPSPTTTTKSFKETGNKYDIITCPYDHCPITNNFLQTMSEGYAIIFPSMCSNSKLKQEPNPKTYTCL
jgi:hypothetical protein